MSSGKPHIEQANQVGFFAKILFLNQLNIEHLRYNASIRRVVSVSL